MDQFDRMLVAQATVEADQESIIASTVS